MKGKVYMVVGEHQHVTNTPKGPTCEDCKAQAKNHAGLRLIDCSAKPEYNGLWEARI